MKFCTKCGKQLVSGQACSCAASKVSVSPTRTPRPTPTRTATPMPPHTPSYPQPHSTPQSQPFLKSLNVNKSAFSLFLESMKNRMGIGEPERNATDTYERGMKIVPDCISENDGEVPVKQYNIAVLRNILRFERAEGRMQVTNKRVIFRAAGRSIGGRTTLQQEFNIDEVAGIEAIRSYRFSLLHLFFGLHIILLFIFIAMFISLSAVPETWTVTEQVERQETYHVDGEARTRTVVENVERSMRQNLPSTVELVVPGLSFITQSNIVRLGFIGTAVSFLIGFGGIVPFFMIKGRFLLKLVFLGASYGALTVVISRWGVFGVVHFIVGILIIVGIFLYCMRPDLHILIRNKGAIDQSPPISIRRRRGLTAWRQESDTGFSEVIPTPESESAIREIGAIISDIQKLGDHGVDRWRT